MQTLLRRQAPQRRGTLHVPKPRLHKTHLCPLQSLRRAPKWRCSFCHRPIDRPKPNKPSALEESNRQYEAHLAKQEQRTCKLCYQVTPPSAPALYTCPNPACAKPICTDCKASISAPQWRCSFCHRPIDRPQTKQTKRSRRVKSPVRSAPSRARAANLQALLRSGAPRRPSALHLPKPRLQKAHLRPLQSLRCAPQWRCSFCRHPIDDCTLHAAGWRHTDHARLMHVAPTPRRSQRRPVDVYR